MKTIESMLHEAEHKKDLWESVSVDEEALIDRGKSATEALMLVQYFEGRADALREVKLMINQLRR